MSVEYPQFFENTDPSPLDDFNGLNEVERAMVRTQVAGQKVLPHVLGLGRCGFALIDHGQTSTNPTNPILWAVIGGLGAAGLEFLDGRETSRAKSAAEMAGNFVFGAITGAGFAELKNDIDGNIWADNRYNTVLEWCQFATPAMLALIVGTKEWVKDFARERMLNAASAVGQATVKPIKAIKESSNRSKDHDQAWEVKKLAKAALRGDFGAAQSLQDIGIERVIDKHGRVISSTLTKLINDNPDNVISSFDKNMKEKKVETDDPIKKIHDLAGNALAGNLAAANELYDEGFNIADPSGNVDMIKLRNLYQAKDEKAMDKLANRWNSR